MLFGATYIEGNEVWLLKEKMCMACGIQMPFLEIYLTNILTHVRSNGCNSYSLLGFYFVLFFNFHSKDLDSQVFIKRKVI